MNASKDGDLIDGLCTMLNQCRFFIEKSIDHKGSREDVTIRDISNLVNTISTVLPEIFRHSIDIDANDKQLYRLTLLMGSYKVLGRKVRAAAPFSGDIAWQANTIPEEVRMPEQ
jgi:hypothetical protein